MSLDTFDEVFESLQSPLRKEDAFFFGTVTSRAPWKVVLDGDSSAVGTTPIMLCRDAIVGSRVLCQLHGRQLIVVAVVASNYLGYADALGNTEHLDNLLDTHLWGQPANVNASTSRGYPVALSGLLEVVRNSSSIATQRYTVYDGSAIYGRTWYSPSGWYPWRALMQDTGWQTVAITYSGFRSYGTGLEPKYRIKNGTVFFGGALASDAAPNATWANLPVPARPDRDAVFQLQGSGNNQWCMRVYSNGDVTAERYGPGTAGTNTWLPFNVQWPTAS